MKRTFLIPLLLVFAGCSSQETPAPFSQSLVEARRGFETTLTPTKSAKTPVQAAPPKIFRTLKYPAPAGELAAYLSPDPGDGKKHPAIIWITGGDCNSIGGVWDDAPRSNDQTAAAYRKAGIILMFPSLRGGNDNPGQKEGFLGEVDDVLAAADFLQKQSYVDEKRIYLGGHSTGGTLALLVAEVTKRFRGVFSFGPVADVSVYGSDSGYLPFDTNNEREIELRSPGYWLKNIESPTWVIEGTDGNSDSLRAMRDNFTVPSVRYIEVRGTDHFAVLAPTNEIIARKIVQDANSPIAFSLTEDEVNRAFTK